MALQLGCSAAVRMPHHRNSVPLLLLAVAVIGVLLVLQNASQQSPDALLSVRMAEQVCFGCSHYPRRERGREGERQSDRATEQQLDRVIGKKIGRQTDRLVDRQTPG